MNFGNFSQRTDIQDTDKVVGHRGTTTVLGQRPESAWTFLKLRQWLTTYFPTLAQFVAHTDATNNPHAVTAAQVGLGSVTNTSDTDKPVSTAQQAALDLKAPLASPALTGAPTAPTAITADSSTKIATTAYVQAVIADVINGAPGALDTLRELAAALGDDASFSATITNALAAKMVKSANLSDLTDVPQAKLNLSLVKADVGLGNATNTSDADKPVSTAQQTAFDLKVDKTSDVTVEGQGFFMKSGFRIADEKLYIWASADGIDWKTVAGRALYNSPSNTLRDPSIARIGNLYYQVYSNNYPSATSSFGLASSPDSVNWTFIANIETGVVGANQVWAPELFVDSDGTVSVFSAVSTNGGTSFKIYRSVAQNAGLTSWATAVDIGLGTNKIDPQVTKIGSTYYLWYKNETTKYLELATSTSVGSGYSVVKSGDHAGWGPNLEGFSKVQLSATKWRAYMVDYTVPTHQIYYSESSDNFATWTAKTAITEDLIGSHGTVIRVLDYATLRNVFAAALGASTTKVIKFPTDTTSATGLNAGGDTFWYRFLKGIWGTIASVASGGSVGTRSENTSSAGYAAHRLVNDQGDTADLGLGGSGVSSSAYQRYGFFNVGGGGVGWILSVGGVIGLVGDILGNVVAPGSKFSWHGSPAAANTVTRFVKAVTAIADNTATTVLTITVPNAAHSAGIRLRLVGSLGAGGAVGANEASQAITYDIGVARTAGKAMNAVISTAFGSSSSVAVAGADTIAVTAAITLNAEGVGVTNTASVKVTIARGGGASTSHSCQVVAEIINANTTGISLS